MFMIRPLYFPRTPLFNTIENKTRSPHYLFTVLTCNHQGIMSKNEATTILFSKEFVKDLELKHRIPPTSVGVRRTKPSSKAVLSELRRQKRERKNKNKESSKIDEVGATSESLVTNSEEVKKKDERNGDDEKNVHTVVDVGGNGIQSPSLKRKHEELESTDDMKVKEEETKKKDDNNTTAEESNEQEETPNTPQNVKSSESEEKEQQPHRRVHNYFQFEINPQAIQEEIAELRNEDRKAYNNLPVMLSPPMTKICLPLLQTNNDSKGFDKVKDQPNIIINDNLATKWAETLHKGIKVEEIERNKEDLRPLAYKLMPEAWTRLRPKSNDNENSTEAEIAKDEKDEGTKESDDQVMESEMSSTHTEEVLSLTCKNIRLTLSDNELSWYDKSHEIVYSCIHNQFPNFHISCGSKFGCDYLIYDGCRMERHAFAGLRILTAPVQNLHEILPNDNGEEDNNDKLFPLPKPHNLTGYVRCLNTAGKLALLALVVKEDSIETTDGMKPQDPSSNKSNCKYHVAIVDLALEKVLTAQAHVRKKAKKNRKVVGLNLDKKPKNLEST